ncbi:MAG: isoprenylcysteine carboxylmethyltransferase family protein [Gemmatimonadota bacterium]|nr:MAG: isoprenylcysteine carboxylmethyltransferase family protein [Gemmatimonadota bacterium]
MSGHTAIFVVSALLWLVASTFIFRVVVRRDYLRHGRLSILSSSLELLVFCLWAWLAYTYRPPDWPAIHVGSVVRVGGWILFAGGMVVAFGTMFVFGMGRAFGLRVGVLKQSGLYRLTRNPQLVAFLVAMIGYLALWPSWYGVGSVAILVVVSHAMVLTEEEHLRDSYGDEYLRYCERVPRYLGPARGPLKDAA